MNIHDVMLFISVSAGFWLFQFLILMFIRTYQVRWEIARWWRITPDRQRMIALLLGLSSFMTFAFLQRAKATTAWFSHSWQEPDWFTLFYHSFIFGILGMLWWAFGAVTNNHGGRWWTASLLLGTLLGLIAVIV